MLLLFVNCQAFCKFSFVVSIYFWAKATTPWHPNQSFVLPAAASCWSASEKKETSRIQKARCNTVDEIPHTEPFLTSLLSNLGVDIHCLRPHMGWLAYLASVLGHDWNHQPDNYREYTTTTSCCTNPFLQILPPRGHPKMSRFRTKLGS